METVENSLTDVIARLTQGDPEPEVVIQRVLDLAVDTIAPVDGASITILDTEGKPFTTSTSAQWVVDVDKIQYAVLQGPCLEVASTSAPVSGSADVATTEAWPVFGPKAREAGVRAIMAAGLSSHPDPDDSAQPPGALNLYARGEEPFSPDDRDRAVLLASMAGLAITLAEQRANTKRLREALSSRDVIGQAKGILMERHGITPDEAFSTLRRASNQLNVKLRDIAVRVTVPEKPRVAPRDQKTRLPRL
ncbi:GAF and ANTAR domain-containing protein [Mariniluteicoccus flavus]